MRKYFLIVLPSLFFAPLIYGQTPKIGNSGKLENLVINTIANLNGYWLNVFGLINLKIIPIFFICLMAIIEYTILFIIKYKNLK